MSEEHCFETWVHWHQTIGLTPQKTRCFFVLPVRNPTIAYICIGFTGNKKPHTSGYRWNKFQIEYTWKKRSYCQVSKPLEVYCIMPNSTQLEASGFQITGILYQIPAEFSAENPLTFWVGLYLKYLIILCHQERGSLIENFSCTTNIFTNLYIMWTAQESLDRKRGGKY